MKKTLLLLLVIIANTSLSAQSFNGFALYNSQGSNTTYLIDENQNIAHSWNLNTECNYAVLLKDNGNLIRGTKYNNNILGGAAEGGRVQEIAPDGSIVWDYIYSDANHLSHHDITLIGDNVLLTAWEVKTISELDAYGYNNATSNKWPTHFIELAPDGNGGANIVWEWYIWDHLCQDIDPNKPNYVANISDHPELIDINMIQSSGGPGGGGPGGGGPGGNNGDWFHVNGVDYNEELDQIVFSSRHASEIYIIDHSTTTAEAATSSGGNSGMGGDILYRWGNPSNYGMSGPQIIPSAVHDSRWIPNDGRPNSGFLQVFNNSAMGNGQSSVDGIKTPIDSTTGYTYTRIPGQPFEPLSYTTRYECAYSANGQSASDRMSNGNIFINASGGQGGAGVMYEVDSLENIIWGPYPAQSQKGFRYECDHPGIIALETYMTNTTTTSCFDNTSNTLNSTTNNLLIYPNPTNSDFVVELTSLKNSSIIIEIYNLLGKNIFSKKINNLSSRTKETFNLKGMPEGMYFLKITANDGRLYEEIISYIE